MPPWPSPRPNLSLPRRCCTTPGNAWSARDCLTLQAVGWSCAPFKEFLLAQHPSEQAYEPGCLCQPDKEERDEKPGGTP